MHIRPQVKFRGGRGGGEAISQGKMTFYGTRSYCVSIDHSMVRMLLVLSNSELLSLKSFSKGFFRFYLFFHLLSYEGWYKYPFLRMILSVVVVLLVVDFQICSGLQGLWSVFILSI